MELIWSAISTNINILRFSFLSFLLTSLSQKSFAGSVFSVASKRSKFYSNSKSGLTVRELDLEELQTKFTFQTNHAITPIW